ncbi:MAG: 8-oxo-dGTP pyrophosphatase MutT (NUDIX family) [Hyphomicrobiaceae bacterium]|jgi:8-oxo-dGTP pyrophosphatase MutT (NUDIX family)
MSDLPIRDAATVLSLRERAGSVEVYMVKRNSRMGFLGGRHVFPGGAVDAADSGAAAAALFHGVDPQQAGAVLAIDDHARARGFLVAAARELYEEAGILLAINEAGAWVDLDADDARASSLCAERPNVAAGDTDFATLLASHGLRLAADRLAHFAHWITPDVEKKRFDTHFFIAPAPAAQSADHDRTESTEGSWMTSAQALARYQAREIELVPPTIATLEWVARFSNVDDAMAAAHAEQVVAILPKIIMGDELVILYPGDCDYESGVPAPIAGRTANRLVVRDGLWERPQ